MYKNAQSAVLAGKKNSYCRTVNGFAVAKTPNGYEYCPFGQSAIGRKGKLLQAEYIIRVYWDADNKTWKEIKTTFQGDN